MSRDKQVEEMVSMMLESSTTANVEPVLEMEGKEVVLGENATKILNNILEQAYIPFLAEALYNAGYRKASEVAREILALVWEAYNTTHYDAEFEESLDEIEKKYTESEK